MGRYQKILVAMDGSASGENALRQALALACVEKCWVRVVTVVPPFEGELELTGVGDVHEAILRPGRAILARAEAIAGESGGLIKTSLEEGEASQRIAAIAAEERCGLVVMGRRGISRLERMAIGSVTARVIGHSPVDVLVVPLGTAIGWKSVLVATDGSAHSAAAAAKAVDFAASYGGRVVALAVVDLPEEVYAVAPGTVDILIAKARGHVRPVAAMSEKAGVSCATAIREGVPAATIVQVAQEEAAGVIVVGSHGRTGLARLLMGSVTEKVIGHAPCPVLVVR
jgi:nucleotide-binding universal stress UspA family protein